MYSTFKNENVGSNLGGVIVSNMKLKTRFVYFVYCPLGGSMTNSKEQTLAMSFSITVTLV